jgi:thiamine biosynthesis lipoprotein
MIARVLKVAAFTAAMVLAGCSDEPETRQAEFLVFGTTMQVTMHGADQTTAERAFNALQGDFQAMHSDWHAWEPGLLTGINEAFAAGAPATATADITYMVSRSRELETLSEGCFNPAIGALVRLWGFHTSDYPVLGPPPSRAAVEELLRQAPSTRDIVIDGNRLYSSNPAVQLDFGGVAKGYAIDLAMQRLRGMGIEHAIVNAGGDLRAIGRRPDRPWRVAIRKPGGGVIGTVETRGDEAVFTSGVYERFRLDDVERYPHILDPRTGWPVAELAAVTVIADEGLLADAAATALIVAGKEGWLRVAAALGLSEVLLIDGDGEVWATEPMSRRVTFSEDVSPNIIADG